MMPQTRAALGDSPHLGHLAQPPNSQTVVQIAVKPLNLHSRSILGEMAKQLLALVSMDAKTHAHFEARARVLKALAHPSRLFMVDVLAKGERCVCELTEMVGADMSTVSKHLSVLRSAGIVTDDKRGMQVYYTLKMPCVLRFFDCVELVLIREGSKR
jgi:DNA-binding transcriptional ArsR family regulator